MIIERINLKDFGIFRDQVMENLHPGLVVIAGANRAGKTTFMKALRYLGYGLPKRDSIPPASGTQHEISADARLTNESRYNIQLLGYSKPKVSPLDNDLEVTIEEIYNRLDGFTFRQVFTISLDELRRIPEETTPGEEQQLQAVLLGGGWSDALRLNQIKEEFRKLAEDIGGKKGSKNVKEFKPYADRIKEGIALRDAANNQMEAYDETQTSLIELESTLAGLQQQLTDLQKELALYEMIRDNGDSYAQIAAGKENLSLPEHQKLLETFPPGSIDKGQRLREEYLQCEQQHTMLSRQFDAVVGLDRLEAILEKGELLETWEKQLSGWRQKTMTLMEHIRGHRNTGAKLKLALGQAYSPWGDDLSQLEKIRLDKINEDLLQAHIEHCKGQHTLLEECSRQMEHIRLKLANKKKESENLAGNKNRQFPGTLILTLLGLAGVMASAALFGRWGALSAGLVAAAGIAAYAFHDAHGSKSARKHYLQSELEDLKEELAVLEGRYKGLEESLKTAVRALEDIIREAGLPDPLSYRTLPDFIKEVRDLRQRYQEWLVQEGDLAEQTARQKRLSGELATLLQQLKMELHQPPDTSEYYDSLYNSIETACDWLRQARELEVRGKAKETLERKIMELLQEEDSSFGEEMPGKSHALIQALQEFIDRGQLYRALKEEQQSTLLLEQNLTKVLGTEKHRQLLHLPAAADSSALLKAFGELSLKLGCTTTEEAEEKGREIEGQKEQLTKEIAAKKEEEIALKLLLSQLASDEKLHQANRIIAGAKLELEAKGEQYAVFRMAEEMVDTVYADLMERTKGSVLNSAGDFFSKITTGDYKTIDLGVDSQDRDFRAVPLGTAKGIETKHLSRGTREQLFLSVRLSRIKGITPPLPVILDDTLVNFDPAHGREAVKLIARLGETHQVFVLTCHPEMLDWIEETGYKVQYWGLDKGKFSGPFWSKEAAAALECR